MNKPVCFPSLIFGIIQEQVNVVVPEDVFEGPAPDIVITSSKLKNTEFHINDFEVISDDDDPLPHVDSSAKGKGKFSAPFISDLFGSMSQQVINELKAESAFLDMTIG